MKTKEAELVQLIIRIISEETKIPLAEIKASHSFFELGLDSVSAVFMMEKLEQHLSIDLNPIFFWDYPTIEKYAHHVVTKVINYESD